ncbi:Asp-tRNA(Asn)/Glu-tRNA(Gln) amidotransferase subunit GatB [Egicoccus halophilus]|uniref:Aspartyl/glutamyl-tRNA(Asn/Gln) amidotransferase subunit B n=1 Tax=Egicoccus halophilus TaxID=1670830 RepID=A0A8J3ETS8_9ACTN|nr:Asp-tRNA(Asn)/Glu-tRNA(Gln) amidotransferase subunit GatB [Egicoccus halophilus]GGI06196.1 aspartyl/glutamyl-tRNA(Asn/Gln) amidotransferase subunit B [Egicoccus halophilus]
MTATDLGEISATTAAEHGAPLLEGDTGEWELVVGLEVHVELNTRTKMWCGCATQFGGEPNTNVCPVCTGQPGALPVVNAQAVQDATLLGLALNGEIAPVCRFHRKNYFYPDLAKNYQISQYDVPLVHDGWLEVEVPDTEDPSAAPVVRRIRIERLHMEEDTGKSMHVGATGRLHGADRSLIDYNRCGIPLLEIVSRPDVHDPDTAQAYLRELQAIVRATGVSDARMEEGSIRCDANVSVRRPGDALGTRTEIKNLNSVRSLGRAIAYEARRQISVLEDGGRIVMETRHWDEGRGVTETLRVKESVTDYRYFPDPDLVEITSSSAQVDEVRARLPELPAATRSRLREAGVAADQAATMVVTGLVPWFDEAVQAGASASAVANWLTGDVAGQLSSEGVELAESGLTGTHVAELIGLIDDGTLSTKLAKQVLTGVIAARGARGPAQVADEQGLKQVSDEGELRGIVEQVVADNAGTVEAIRGGNDKAIGALVGQVMKQTRGQADPRKTNELLREVIGS